MAVVGEYKATVVSPSVKPEPNVSRQESVPSPDLAGATPPSPANEQDFTLTFYWRVCVYWSTMSTMSRWDVVSPRSNICHTLPYCHIAILQLSH